jgi:hypothetical protein
MPTSDYIVVATIRNESAVVLHIYLEMLPVQVVMSPGHSIDLLARPSDGLLPITIDYVSSGLQVHPHKEFDPDWHVRFKGQLIRAEDPTVLSDYE